MVSRFGIVVFMVFFSRPAEVWPWEVRFAHPSRAHARHPIHKAMGGHASHGHISDHVFIPFQLREGTIKTLWPRTPISRLLFNSIMVQLEQDLKLILRKKLS